MNDPCPCYNCSDRSANPNCHSADGKYCKHDYIGWAKRNTKRREERQKKEQEIAAAVGAKVDSLRRIYRHQKRSWKR